MEKEGQKIREAGRDAGEAVKSGASELAEMGKETGRRFTAAMESAKNNIQEKTTASAKATDRAIREHPYQSIGIAFGIGLLLGVLINRR